MEMSFNFNTNFLTVAVQLIIFVQIRHVSACLIVINTENHSNGPATGF